MILYLDTSALVKLFVEEAYSGRVRRVVSEARLTATHAIAYVEACAAFARVAFDRRNEALFSALRRNLEVQWEAWEILAVTEPLIRRAADLTGRYRLRGYDSLHLAAAESAFEVFRGHTPFQFAVFDDQLRAAAKQAGIPMIEI
ncbi:MAG TPA: type II toxin-antitoxin system VapC family toxin [Burkholderiales bacterium]|nr:type II toxin-antitoxin system VapC family toxin [Burkholderiales bacterium]